MVRACLQQNVQRLIHCSTVDVVIGFKPICGGTEDTTPIPKQFLFPGYPESKLRAEQLVLAANEQLCSNGNIWAYVNNSALMAIGLLCSIIGLCQ